MNSLNELTVVVPSFHCPEFIEILIKSFERFRPSDLGINYVVVENSSDESYRDAILRLGPHVMWIQNPLDYSHFFSNVAGSFANALGLQRGLEVVTTEWVFLAHNDVCVTSTAFFDELRKRVEQGYSLVGTVRDNARVKAIHISGCLVRTQHARSVNLLPELHIEASGPVGIVLDVGDRLDLMCQSSNLRTFCYPNTENDSTIALSPPFDGFNVDRCVNEKNEVIFMHLGRGSVKMAGHYRKPGKVLKDEWVRFCQQFC
jgi:hypothetical protein